MLLLLGHGLRHEVDILAFDEPDELLVELPRVDNFAVFGMHRQFLVDLIGDRSIDR